MFDSRIDDWILWIGSPKLGIYTPINIRRVHSYGIETKLSAEAETSGGWRLLLDGNFAWTRSINRGDPFSPADESVGKQLVYIPVYSAALTARVEWRRWELTYKWNWYSERYTMSSNDLGVLGRVKPYFMSDLSLEKGLDCKWASFSLKGCIHNLLNEEYESVLSRPMPRLNVSFFIWHNPQIRQTMTLREQMLELTEPKYMKFTSALMPGVENVLGIRLPYCAASPKEIAAGDWRAYLAKAEDFYFEERMLQGLVIGYAGANPPKSSHTWPASYPRSTTGPSATASAGGSAPPSGSRYGSSYNPIFTRRPNTTRVSP